MSTPTPTPPLTEEQRWSGPAGDRWLKSAPAFEAALQPIADALLPLANLSPGQHVLDVGSGAGAMALQITRHIAPSGSVTALDISPGLTAEAQRRAKQNPPPAPITFHCADAASASLPKHHFDRLLSRFGIMFFTDPIPAFAHLHSLLKPAGTGKLAVAAWLPIDQNPWMLEARTILAKHFDLPTPPPRSPGPFAFDDPTYFHQILSAAGFKNIAHTPFHFNMHIAGPNTTPENAAHFLLNSLGFAQPALEAPEHLRKEIHHQLTARLQNFQSPTGTQLPASLYFTTATT